MSIKFPIVLEEVELHRLIKEIVKVTIEEVKPLEIKPFLSLNDCYKLSKSKLKTLNAIRKGDLKLSNVGGKQVVRRKDFLEWINNDTPVRKYPETKIRRNKPDPNK